MYLSKNNQENENCRKLIFKLASLLDHCQHILLASSGPLQIFPIYSEKYNTCFSTEDTDKFNIILNKIADKFNIKVPEFVCQKPTMPTSIEMGLSKFCDLKENECLEIVRSDSAFLIINNMSTNGITERLSQSYLQSNNMPKFSVFSVGIPSREVIILVPPCGVPARLFQPWLESFSKKNYVITWENPYLFDEWRTLPEPTEIVSLEIKFIEEFLIKNNILKAHLIGICGGAPIALAAAEKLGSKISSVVICHGDLYFGKNTFRTSFQNQFQGYLLESVESYKRSKKIYEMFLDPALFFNIPRQLCVFVTYPYANFKLYNRYANMNLELMSYNATSAASKIKQPVKIITSSDDRMTHSEASHQLNEILENSIILERKSGNHHEILIGNDELFYEISNFISAHKIKECG